MSERSNVVHLPASHKGSGFTNPYALDPHFRTWVSWQNRLAMEAELPYEEHGELARRYVRLMDKKRAAIDCASPSRATRLNHDLAGAFA